VVLSERQLEYIDKLMVSFTCEESDAGDRETSVLYSYFDKVVVFETTHLATAKRWRELLMFNPLLELLTSYGSLRFEVDMQHCRKPEYWIKAKHRNRGEK